MLEFYNARPLLLSPTPRENRLSEPVDNEPLLLSPPSNLNYIVNPKFLREINV